MNTEARLPEQFRFIRELGTGGMATVYLVFDNTLGCEVALKELSPDSIRNTRALTRFKREFLTLSSLTHANIVKIYELIEEDNGRLFFTLEYVQGESLSSLLKGNKLSIEEKTSISLQIAKALAYAHSKGVLHRDIKPSNIVVNEKNEVKLLDFGIALNVAEDLSLTEAGSRLGTPSYMSPEQLQKKGHNEIDHRSDIYSYGLVIFELFTGRPTFEYDTLVQVTTMHLVQEPPKVQDCFKDAPAWVEKMVSICLQKKPEDRYDSMDDIIKKIENSSRQPESKKKIFNRVKQIFK